MNVLPFSDYSYLKIKIIAYGHEACTNFCGLNVSEDGAECDSFTIASTDFLLVYENKYYLQVYLGSLTYKIVGLDNHLFEIDED